MLKLNVELLTKVRDHILAHPTTMNMNEWLERGEDPDLAPSDCGTVGCIAGWACELSNAGAYNIPQTATTLLGLLKADPSRAPSGLLPYSARALFHVEDWPKQFRDDLSECEPQTPEYAAVVARRIDSFIATEGKA